jgi:hypothetical protein
MGFRVGGDLQLEVIAGLGADELHQLIGVAQLATGVPHTGGQVTTQGNNALDAAVAVVVQQGAQILARVTHTGQVRRCRYTDFVVQLQHGTAGAVTG